jgi:hypothetical protein
MSGSPIESTVQHAMNPTRRWYDDPEEVLRLAHALSAAGLIQTVDEVLYMIEKPWKWTAEYNRFIHTGTVEVPEESESDDGEA